MDNIIMLIFAVIGGGLGIVTTVYLVVSAFVTCGQKIYGKIKYGKSLYD